MQRQSEGEVTIRSWSVTPGFAVGIVTAQVLGVEQVGDHARSAARSSRWPVDHVLVERLGHQLLGLRVHPGGDKRHEVQPGAAVEHQLVVDELVCRSGSIASSGRCRDGIGEHASLPV
jgi:hypothetical protein